MASWRRNHGGERTISREGAEDIGRTGLPLTRYSGPKTDTTHETWHDSRERHYHEGGTVARLSIKHANEMRALARLLAPRWGGIPNR